MHIVKQRQVYWVDLEKVFPKGKHYQKGANNVHSEWD